MRPTNPPSGERHSLITWFCKSLSKRALLRTLGLLYCIARGVCVAAGSKSHRFPDPFQANKKQDLHLLFSYWGQREPVCRRSP
jgi:hypothetical protein